MKGFYSFSGSTKLGGEFDFRLTSTDIVSCFQEIADFTDSEIDFSLTVYLSVYVEDWERVSILRMDNDTWVSDLLELV
jgi:hypothetical protein